MTPKEEIVFKNRFIPEGDEYIREKTFEERARDIANSEIEKMKI